MKVSLVKSSTSVILTVFIQDNSQTDGRGLGSLDENSSIVGGYVKRNGTGVALAVDENVTTEGTYEAPSAAGKVRIGTSANMTTGTYELHFHNDLFTTADWVTITLGGAASMAPLLIEVQLTTFDLNSATPDVNTKTITAGIIANASFNADVGSTAHGTNIIALAVRKILEELNLDHLMKVTTGVAADSDLEAYVVAGTVLAHLMATGADVTTFKPSTDSLQSIRDVAPHGSAMVGTDSAALASVVGALADAAADGGVTEADTLMKYIKQLINILIGAPGVVAFPAAAAPANGVSLAEIIREIHVDISASYVAQAAKMLAYVRLLARSDAAVETDAATELTAINADEGAGAGNFTSQTDAQEALRDAAAGNITSIMGTALSETSAGNFAANLSTFCDNADALTAKTLDDVGAPASGGGSPLVIGAGDVGDFKDKGVVHFFWHTIDRSGAAVAPSTAGTIRVYKDDGTGEVTAPTGITDTRDFDGVTGLHECKIDLSASTFYAKSKNYSVILPGAVIDTKTVNAKIGSFSIENRWANIHWEYGG